MAIQHRALSNKAALAVSVAACHLQGTSSQLDQTIQWSVKIIKVAYLHAEQDLVRSCVQASKIKIRSANILQQQLGKRQELSQLGFVQLANVSCLTCLLQPRLLSCLIWIFIAIIALPMSHTSIKHIEDASRDPAHCVICSFVLLLALFWHATAQQRLQGLAQMLTNSNNERRNERYIPRSNFRQAVSQSTTA